MTFWIIANQSEAAGGGKIGRGAGAKSVGGGGGGIAGAAGGGVNKLKDATGKVAGGVVGMGGRWGTP